MQTTQFGKYSKLGFALAEPTVKYFRPSLSQDNYYYSPKLPYLKSFWISSSNSSALFLWPLQCTVGNGSVSSIALPFDGALRMELMLCEQKAGGRGDKWCVLPIQLLRLLSLITHSCWTDKEIGLWQLWGAANHKALIFLFAHKHCTLSKLDMSYFDSRD